MTHPSTRTNAPRPSAPSAPPSAPPDSRPPAAPPAAPPAPRSRLDPPIGIAGGAEASPNLCGQPVAQGTGDGKAVSKPCVKDAGHEGEHSTEKYRKTPPVTLDMLASLEAVTSDESPAATLVRDEVQQTVDGHVKANHDAWKAAGSPVLSLTQAIGKGLAMRYFIAPDTEAGFRKLLKAAGELHDVKVKIDPKPRKHVDGRTMLYWIAVNKPAEKPATKAA